VIQPASIARWSAPPSPLIDDLSKRLARGDRATTAVLRRQARTMQQIDPAAVAVVYPLVGSHYRSQDSGMLVACLWALWHLNFDRPVNSADVNLGRALRRLPNPDRAQRLFTDLATATGPTLPGRLVHAIDALGAAQIPLDWRLLHRDLRSWMFGRQRQVLRRWATGLHSPDRQPDMPPAPVPATVAEKE
jgi:CRISPR type I-E-associated protein CasB/Cse2